jgi:hypothetical protein
MVHCYWQYTRQRGAVHGELGAASSLEDSLEKKNGMAKPRAANAMGRRMIRSVNRRMIPRFGAGRVAPVWFASLAVPIVRGTTLGPMVLSGVGGVGVGLHVRGPWGRVRSLDLSFDRVPAAVASGQCDRERETSQPCGRAACEG